VAVRGGIGERDGRHAAQLGTAITVTTSTDGTANNAESIAADNTATASYTLSGFPDLYFRVGTAEGAAATANIEIQIVPL